MIMRRFFKFFVVVVVVAVSASLGVPKNDVQHPVLPSPLVEVEASAACETSSSSSLNYGHCVSDVNNKQEYCASGKGTPECNATI